MRTTPVFVTVNDVDGSVSVNERQFSKMSTALNVARKERDMNVYLQLLDAQEFEHETLPVIDSVHWELVEFQNIGQDNMIQLEATEDIVFKFKKFEYTMEAGSRTGWFLDSPANLKSMRERNLFLSQGSILFGDAIGKCALVNSVVIGTIKDTIVKDSEALYVNMDKVFLEKSGFINVNATEARVRHSNVTVGELHKCVLTSSEARNLTLINGLLSDGGGDNVGLNNSIVTGQMFVNSKISNTTMNGEYGTTKDTCDNLVSLKLIDRLRAVSRKLKNGVNTALLPTIQIREV